MPSLGHRDHRHHPRHLLARDPAWQYAAAFIAAVGLRPVRVRHRAQLELVETLTALRFTLALRQSRSRHPAFKMFSD